MSNKTSNNGENEAEHVEQITRTPSNVSQRSKDPKRVAAGKKLAEKNRQMREEYAKYKAAEASTTAETSTTENSEWFPKLSFTNAISLVGIGLTVFNLFLKSKDKPPSNRTRLSPIREDRESQCEPTSKVPRFGMQ